MVSLLERLVVGRRSSHVESSSNNPGVIDPREFGVSVNRASLIDRGEASVYVGGPDRRGRRHVLKVYDVPFISEGYVTPELLREYQRITDQVGDALSGETTVISAYAGVSVTLSTEPIERAGALASESGPASAASGFVPGLRLIDVLEPNLPFHQPRPTALPQDLSKLRLFRDEIEELLDTTSQRLNRQLGVGCISIDSLNIKPIRRLRDVYELRTTDVCGIVTDIDPSIVADRPAMLDG